MTATDPIENLQALIRCPSVTPAEGGALSALETMLVPLGFTVERITATEAGTPDIENLYARLGGGGPHLMFAGHTVVPVGDEAAWSHPPFAAEIADGVLYGRGAVDMKGGVACFTAAVARHIEKHGRPNGSISFLITGDEEGPAVNGTVKLLDWAHQKGEHWDACLVGEPTNPEQLGDMIKIGRRGSLSGTVTVHGVQGHVAYPHLADNPVRAALAMAAALMEAPFDAGTADFQPSNMEVTTIDTGNTTSNIIPQDARARINIRFNPAHTGAELQAWFEALAAEHEARSGAKIEVQTAISGEAFLTEAGPFVDLIADVIQAKLGLETDRSTTGGTSDARFIRDLCPVVEFGLVGQTMHQINECASVADLEALTDTYSALIEAYFSKFGSSS